MEIQHNVKLLFVFIVVVVGWVFFLSYYNCCNGTAVIGDCCSCGFTSLVKFVMNRSYCNVHR